MVGKVTELKKRGYVIRITSYSYDIVTIHFINKPRLDIDNLTPVEALNKLYNVKKLLK